MPTKKSKKWIWIMLIAVGVISAGVGAYFVFRKPATDTAEPVTEEVEDSEDEESDDDTDEEEGPEEWTTEDGKRIEDPYFFDVSVVELDDGSYRMYGEVHGQVDSYVSEDGLEWEKEDGVRMADAGFPFVTKTDDGKWRMFYTSMAPGQSQTYFLSAISDDGLTFEEESGHRYDASSDYEERIQGPRIIEMDDGTYRMYFTAMAGSGSDEKSLILSATSEDGLNFEYEGLILTPDDEPFVGGRIAHAWPIKTSSGKIKLYFAAATTAGGGIITAISEDGLDFLVDPKAIIDQEGESAPSPQDPCLIEMDDGWRMYYGIYQGPTVIDESAIYSAIKD